MEYCQPSIENIIVDAAWDGSHTSPLSLVISIHVAVPGKSQLSLIQRDHPSILSAEVVHISKLTSTRAKRLSTSPRHHRSPHRALDSSNPHPDPAVSPANQHQVNQVENEEDEDHALVHFEAQQEADVVGAYKENGFVPVDGRTSWTASAEIPHFSQTASLYEASSSRDSALSPPPPATSKKLTIRKRLSLEPDTFCHSIEHSPTKHALSGKGDSSPRSIHRRPVSLDKRPLWRPVGVKDTTLRGRRKLGTDTAKRRVSRSTGAIQLHRGRTRHRQSSLPGRITKTARGVQDLPGKEHQRGTQTLPRGATINDHYHSTARDRDITVKVTRYAEAMTAGERLEKWLEERRHDWGSGDEFNELYSDEDESIRFPNFDDFRGSPGPALSPSPTPSSRAALPWTSIPGMRGGGSIYGADSEFVDEEPVPSLVEENGTIFAYFCGATAAESKINKFRIKIHAAAKLEHQQSGCQLLTIPGLPQQSGNMMGTFNLTISTAESTEHGDFKAYEKLAYVDADFRTHPLDTGQMFHAFRLDAPLTIKLLCFEDCRALDPSEFEIDSDVKTRYDWENLDGDGITAEHSMICSLRLHPFLMWAQSVKLKLFLVGGPSGTLETTLGPGSRRIYLDGDLCDAEHEMEISLVCPVADLQKPFTLSWEQSLGVAPFETWLPRISGLYRKKLDDVFDLPLENTVSVAPRPCKKSRAYSMDAQARFLKSSGEVYFFPENQLTQKVIQQSLASHSGQFYDELTAKYSDSASPTPLSEQCRTPVIPSTVNLQIAKRLKLDIPKTSGSLSPQTTQELARMANETKNLSPAMLKETTAKTESTASAGEAPPSRLFFLIRWLVFLLHMLHGLFSRLAAPAKILRMLIMAWLCFRAFNHDRVVELEQSLKSKATDAWNNWDFEPVQLYDDFTGWKHLIAKVNQGAARVIHDGHIGVLSPMDFELDNDEETVKSEGEMEQETASAQEEVAKNTIGVTEPEKTREQSEPTTSAFADRDLASKDPYPILDKIDRALGWRPPA
jgi:hypothetical protein